MARNSATLALKITGDSSGARSALDDVDGHASKFGSSMGKLGGLVAGAFAVGAIVDFGKEAFDSASNLEQMAGSVDAVFGKSADQIHKLSEAAHTAVGLSTADYDQMASVIGSQLKNAGVPMDQLAGKTNDLVKKGADMSAVFGGSASDAVEALSSVMKGEFDPIEKYGVSLNQTAINAELAKRGQDHLTGAALKSAQTQAALDLVTKQTAATHGQFAKQSDTAAEKSQQLGAWFENLKAKIGAGLLPIFTSLASFFTDKVSPALDLLFRKGGPVSKIFGTIAQFVKTQLIPQLSSLYKELAPKLIPIFQTVSKIITGVVIPAFKGIWGFVKDYVIPYFRNVLGPVISGIQTAFKKAADAVMHNKDKFVEIYEKIKPFLAFARDVVAPIIGGTLKKAFEFLGDAIGPVVDLITWVLDKAGAVLGVIGKVGNFLFGGGSSGGGAGAPRGASLFGATATGAAPFRAAGSLGAGGVGPTAGAVGLTAVPVGDTYTITVNGALDPAAVADQIGRLLDRRARQLGTSFAVAAR